MGSRRPILPHEQIVAIISGNSDPPVQALVDQLKNENDVYQALFELIDWCKSHEGSSRPSTTHSFPTTFPAIESVLLRIFSGEGGREEASQLLAGLLTSSIFYQRLLVKLASLTPQLSPAEAEELESITIKSDDEILALVKEAAGGTPEPSHKRSVWSVLADTFRQVRTEVLESLQGSLDSLARLPRPAYAIPLLVLAGIGIYSQFRHQATGQPYVFDNEPPPLFASGLRGPDSSAAEDSLLMAFRAAFKLALSDYKLCNYYQVISALEDLEPIAAALQTKEEIEYDATLLNDYYYCFGVSHFALSRSHRFKLDAQERRQHGEMAIQLLTRALALAEAYQLSNLDRDTFFLALAQGFAGDRQAAISQLNKIPTMSTYYDESIELIKRWSES